MTITPAARIFTYSGLTLPDPDSRLSPEDVKAAYATQYPELATAAINGPGPDPGPPSAQRSVL